ncbi:MAG: outer membrane protein transport protein, partial [Desulfovibrionaceae bacterium]|nr:outer membrane protein transport protein [Desulfovibrionaceae bacterium]
LDWWALRAGVYYETPVVNEDYADFMMPTYGRTGLTAGMGFKWENFTLDLAYAHLIINQLDYSTTRNEGVTAGVKNAKSEDCVANIYSLSLGYTF